MASETASTTPAAAQPPNDSAAAMEQEPAAARAAQSTNDAMVAEYAAMKAKLEAFERKEAAAAERKLAALEGTVKQDAFSAALRSFAASREPVSAEASADAQQARADELAAEFQRGYLSVMANPSLHPIHEFALHAATELAAARKEIAAKEAELVEARASVDANQRLRKVLDGPGESGAPKAGEKRSATAVDEGVAEGRAAKRARPAVPSTGNEMCDMFDSFMASSERSEYQPAPALTPEMMQFNFFEKR